MEFIVALFLNANAILNKISVAVGNCNSAKRREQFYFRDLFIPIGHQRCTEFTGEYVWECDFHCWVKDLSQRFAELSCHFSSGASGSTVSYLELFVFLIKKQRWSPRGHILMSLASKVKSLVLASRPQVLENWPVLSSRTAVFFEL